MTVPLSPAPMARAEGSVTVFVVMQFLLLRCEVHIRRPASADREYRTIRGQSRSNWGQMTDSDELIGVAHLTPKTRRFTALSNRWRGESPLGEESFSTSRPSINPFGLHLHAKLDAWRPRHAVSTTSHPPRCTRRRAATTADRNQWGQTPLNS